MKTPLVAMLGLIAVAALCLALSGPSALGQHQDANAGASASADANMAFAQKAVAMLDKCSACHGHGWDQGTGKPKINWGQDVPRLIKEKLVVPGKPEESKLYNQIKAGKHPGNAPARPSAEDIKAFAQWITQGCLDPVTHAASQPATSHAADHSAGH